LSKIRKIFPFILFLSLIVPVSSQTKNSEFKNRIESLLSTNFFNSTLAAVKIYNLSTSEILYEKNNKYLLRPASNLKLFTTAAGLIFLGKDFQFKTKAYYTGKILNGTLYGDVYIKGGFDPFFNVDDLDSLISGLKKLQVKKITGNIFADVSSMDSLFWGKGWMWDDDPDPSAPYLTSLNINRNSVKVITEPRKVNHQSIVAFYPESKYYSTEADVISIKGDSSKIKVSRDWINRKNKIFVNGFQFYKDEIDTSEVNIFRPEFFFITLLKEKLNNMDIKISGKLDTLSTPESAVEFSIVERGLDSVIIKTNKESNNLGAEMILYALAEKFNGFPAAAENGVKLIDSLITMIGNNPEHYRIVDGSGVSHYNLISADLIIDLLKYMYFDRKGLFDLYFNSLPTAGVDGTLDGRMVTGPAYNNVHAKTGTLSGVSNISGYVRAINGDTLAFSILMQNFVGKSKPARDIQDSLCTIFSLFK